MQYRHKQAIDTDPASECIGAAYIRQCGVRSRLTWLMANWLKYDKHYCFTFLLGGAGQQIMVNFNNLGFLNGAAHILTVSHQDSFPASPLTGLIRGRSGEYR